MSNAGIAFNPESPNRHEHTTVNEDERADGHGDSPSVPAVPLVDRSARERRVMSAAKASAVATTTLIASASFVLSFSALRDLATRAGIPRALAWLWPVIVDGSIVQATIAVIALAPLAGATSARRFFWSVLGSAAAVSIAGNSLHAVISATTVSPVAAAVIATVAPVSLLAATHGLALLVRAPDMLWASNHKSGPDSDSVGSSISRATSPESQWLDVAARICDADSSGRRELERVALILTLRHDDGWSCRRIGQHVGAHHSTVARIVEAARAHGNDQGRQGRKLLGGNTTQDELDRIGV